jgi:CDGSH-type Zn-finger protein
MATKVKSTKDGPLQVSGGVVVENVQGEKKEFEEGKDAWLCRCGASKNKPYCDGSHKRIGFKADK